MKRLARVIEAVTVQIIDNLLLPPVALGFELAETVSEHERGA